MTNSLLFGIATFVYFFAMVLYISYLAFRSEGLGKAASLSLLGGVLVETAAIGLRWYESYALGIGRAPLTNMYESLVFFALTIALIYLVLERKYRVKTVGAFIAPFPFIVMAYAALNTNEIQPLVPALQSNWLISHVVTCFVGYAAFAVSFAVSILYLFKAKSERISSKLPVVSQQFPSRLFRTRRDRLQDHRHRVSAFDDRHCNGRLLGKRGLGNVLELGPEGNVVAHRLAHLCGVPARQDHPRLARKEGGRSVHCRFRGYRVLLSRREPGSLGASQLWRRLMKKETRYEKKEEKIKVKTTFVFGWFIMILAGLIVAGDGSAAERNPPFPSYGSGAVEVRIYSDYFCSPCRAMEPAVEPILKDLLKKKVIQLTLVDTPFHPHTALYARYFLYALKKNNDVDHALPGPEDPF